MAKKRNVNDQQLKRIKAELRIGIAKIESGGSKDPYNALPPWKKYPKGHAKAGEVIEPKQRVSSAVGKYQFLKQWWSKNDNNIKGFIDKSQGVFGDTKDLSEKEGMELFRKNPELQDAYFDYYSEKVLIPEALKMMDKNPLNLSVAEMAGQFHFQAPSVARQGISSGTLTAKTDTNVSGYKYIDTQRQAVKEAGLEPITSMDIINAKTESKTGLSPTEKNVIKNNDQIVEDFKKQEQAIEDLGLENPEILRKKLYEKVVAQGGRDAVNQFIEKRNKENSVKYAEDVSEYNEMLDLMEKVEIGYLTPNKKEGRKNRQFKDTAYFVSWDKEDVEQREKLRKKYPDMFLRKEGGSSDYQNHMNLPAMRKTFQDMHKKLTGEEIDITPNVDKVNENEVGNIKKQGRKNLFDIGQGDNRVGQLEFKKIGKITNSKYQEQPIISEEYFPDKSIMEYEPEPEPEEKGKPKDVIDESISEPEEKEAQSLGLADEYFQNELALGGLNDDQFNYEPGKKELPIDAITGFSLGLIGNEQAKNANIPLRTEEVSEAFKSFAAELSSKSKEGMPVEIEAAMKNQLADAYQGGLANIVNSSAGNRATVLGNLGSLEASKTKGLVAIQVADYEAKDRAFAQYGQALKYMNDFDANRDIANHRINYAEQKGKQERGRTLATAGFGKMIEALKYDRENGPGSANDQYRSMLMQKMFGFDPKMPDDGTGTVRGTKSFYDKNKALQQKSLTETKALHSRFKSLNPNQKESFNKLIEQTTDKKVMTSYLDHLQRNPEKDLTNTKMDNLDLAIKDNNFDLLTLNRKNVLSGSTEAVSEIKSEGMQGMGLETPKIPSLATQGFNVSPEQVGGNSLTDPNFLIDAEQAGGNSFTDPYFLMNKKY